MSPDVSTTDPTAADTGPHTPRLHERLPSHLRSRAPLPLLLCEELPLGFAELPLACLLGVRLEQERHEAYERLAPGAAAL